MSQHFHPPVFANRTKPCSECSGVGGHVEVLRACGEAFDADWRDVSCDWCEGTGTVAAGCACCEAVSPLDDDGVCLECSGFVPFQILPHLSDTTVFL